MLVLDEPTNDLDIDTLELLEELLQAYAGTVFLVSHDRRFLDNVVTSTIAWEGDPAFGGRPGLWREYEGGYEDWQHAARTQRAVVGRAPAVAAAPAAAPAAAVGAAAPRTKLSYKEQRELDALPGAHRGAGGRAEVDRRGHCRPCAVCRRTRNGRPSCRRAMRRSTTNCWPRWSAGKRSARALTLSCARLPNQPSLLRRRVGAADDQPGLQVQAR